MIHIHNVWMKSDPQPVAKQVMDVNKDGWLCPVIGLRLLVTENSTMLLHLVYFG
jgi:hypothetical protein